MTDDPTRAERILPKRDGRELTEALRIRALALTGEKWERTATADMMKEAAQWIEDALAEVQTLRVEREALSRDLEQTTRAWATAADDRDDYSERAKRLRAAAGRIMNDEDLIARLRAEPTGLGDAALARIESLTAHLAETQAHWLEDIADQKRLAAQLTRVIRRTKELGFCGEQADDELAVDGTIRALERLDVIEPSPVRRREKLHERRPS